MLTTVGPYAKYGSDLVAACVRNGTHYCDLCGEVQWMRKMIDEHQAAAAASGAKIVMSCGFDSIPSDFGTWYLQQQAMRLHNVLCESVTLLVRAMKGGASGGTFASMLNAIDEARQDRNIARILVDPYGLNPEGAHRGSDKRDQTGAVYNADTDLVDRAICDGGCQHSRRTAQQRPVEFRLWEDVSISRSDHNRQRAGRSDPGNYRRLLRSACLSWPVLLT